MKSILMALAMLAVMSVGVTIPAARAAPILDHLNVTIAIAGQSSTATIVLADVDGDGVITFTLSSTTLSQITGAFGTTTFNFPGSFKGTFHVATFTITVTLQSSDMFILKFVSV